MNRDNYLIISGSILIITIIGTLTWLFIRLDRVETMSVRSKEWYRDIKELEDYQTYECHTRTRTDSDGKLRTYQDCGYETHTRTINSWPSSGIYPAKPFWRTDYTIGLGHYERRYENYVIRLSDDKELWNYSVNSEEWYDTFPVRGNCEVGLNWFNIIIKVIC